MGLVGTLGRAAVAAFGELAKADTAAPAADGQRIDPAAVAKDDPKSLFFDPYSVLDQMGYKEKPTSMSYDTIKAVYYRMPILPIILQTRINQVASFARPQENRFEMGFRVRKRDHKAKPTPEDRKKISELQRFLMNTGVTENPRGRAGFETFLRKVTRDSLLFDQWTAEVVPNRKGQPAEFYSVDASTIRLADTASLTLDEDDTKQVRYVQVYDGSIINEYTQDELIFGVRNPSTELRCYGYGTSEIEMVMAAITSLIYSWDYNSRIFSQGSTAKGILNFKGSVPERMLKAFKQQWYQMLTGVENAWRTPITNAEDLQWISMSQSNKDMEFNAWMDFLLKVLCGSFSMDPSEINFKYGNTGQSNAMAEENNRDKVTESRERGLRPILSHMSGKINDFLIQPGNPDFEVEFVGLDANTRDAAADLAGKRIKSFQTIDEIRAEDDLEPLPNNQGKIILDPTFMQVYMSSQPGQQAGPGEGAPPMGADPASADGDEQPSADEDDDMQDDGSVAPQGMDEDDNMQDDDEGEATQKSLTAPVHINLNF